MSNLMEGDTFSPVPETITHIPLEVKIPEPIATAMVENAENALGRYGEADLHVLVNRGGKLAANVAEGLAEATNRPHVLGPDAKDTIDVYTGRHIATAFADEIGYDLLPAEMPEQIDPYLDWLHEKAKEPGSIVNEAVDDAIASLRDKQFPLDEYAGKQLRIMILDDVKNQAVTAYLTTPTIMEIALQRLGLQQGTDFVFVPPAFLGDAGWADQIIQTTFVDYLGANGQTQHALEIFNNLARGEYWADEAIKPIETINDIKSMCEVTTERWKPAFTNPYEKIVEMYGEAALLKFPATFRTALQDIGKKGVKSEGEAV